MIHFHPLEVVARGSETQLQVGEKFKKMTSAFRNVMNKICIWH